MACNKYKSILFLIIILTHFQCSSTSKNVKIDSKDQEGDLPAHRENKYNYYSIGIIEQNKGNPRKAVYYFKKAFKIDRASEIAHEIASCYLQVEDLANAENYIKQAISISPNNLDHRLMLVNIYLLRQDHEKAINELKEITAIHSNNQELFYDIGRIHQNIGNYEKAILYYNKVLKLDESHEDSLFSLGNIYFNLSQKKEAIKYFEDFLNFQEENLEAKFTYAYLLSLTGEYDKAAETYEQLFEILPESGQL